MRVHVAPFRHCVFACCCPSLLPSTTILAELPVAVQLVQPRGAYPPPFSESSIEPVQASMVGLVTCTPSIVVKQASNTVCPCDQDCPLVFDA